MLTVNTVSYTHLDVYKRQIVISSQVVLGLQTIQSRQVNVLMEPSVITIGAINGGNRSNIIPEWVEMIGTVRSLDEGMRRDIHRRIVKTAQSVSYTHLDVYKRQVWHRASRPTSRWAES